MDRVRRCLEVTRASPRHLWSGRASDDERRSTESALASCILPGESFASSRTASTGRGSDVLLSMSGSVRPARSRCALGSSPPQSRVPSARRGHGARPPHRVIPRVGRCEDDAVLSGFTSSTKVPARAACFPKQDGKPFATIHVFASRADPTDRSLRFRDRALSVVLDRSAREAISGASRAFLPVS
jgi:hypothetical protein